jgi:hypothetical protein
VKNIVQKLRTCVKMAWYFSFFVGGAECRSISMSANRTRGFPEVTSKTFAVHVKDPQEDLLDKNKSRGSLNVGAKWKKFEAAKSYS